MKLKIKITDPRINYVGYRPFLIALASEFDITRFSVSNVTAEGKQVVIATLKR